MLNLTHILKHEQLLKDLTGMSRAEFEEMLPKFEEAWREGKKKKYARDPDRTRKPGGGRKGYLKTMPERLFFIALYYHVHPTYAILQRLFGYTKGSARKRVRALRPVYEQAVGKKLKVPRSRVGSIDVFLERYPEAGKVFPALAAKKEKKGKGSAGVHAHTKKDEKYIFTDSVVVESAASPTASFAPPASSESASAAPPGASPAMDIPSSELREEEAPVSSEQREGKSQEVTTDDESRNQGINKSKEQEGEETIDQEIKKSTEQEEATTPTSSPLQGGEEEAGSEEGEETIDQEIKKSKEQDGEGEETINQGIKKAKDQENEGGEGEDAPEWQKKLDQKMKDSAAVDAAKKKEAEEKEVKSQRETSQKLSEIKEKINNQLKQPTEEMSIIEFVDAILQEAYFSGASDIHVEPQEKDVVVRLRIDGVLHDMVTYPRMIHSAVITRIKVTSGLRTDEHQAAQDGRFKAQIPDVGFADVRVSIAPTYYGENCVMRILTQQKEFTLEEIGMGPKDLETITRAAKRPYGMILSCGPTGSGKTTTLYAVVKLLNTRDVAIVTIEDPIEYSIEGIDQIQVNPKTGLTFSSGLRALLRQDPDTIMVGEIRDEETAGIATNAALTGHLLLSTIHTNDAATALPRLADMGIEPFLVASTVNIIIGQRLVRRICEHCKESYELTKENIEDLSKLVDMEIFKGTRTFYRGKGCSTCNDSGYRGRVGIFEVLEMEENIKKLIMSRATSDDIKYVAMKNGMTTMLEDGVRKAIAGATTVEEVLRVAKE